ncbi:MAG: DNA polymerase III subunit alpha [Calditrichaeota bacterium]|nr:MAG: DNA polymerase III subunit alpha [Calditrichota bacterium]
MPQDQFIHLHNHSHYSLLDGLCKVKEFVSKAKEFDMPGIALTDHGNMFGAIEFYNECTAQGIKPIIGCETYMTRGGRTDRGKNRGGGMHHLILLAKNEIGFQNLMQLSSIGYLEGFYYKPRIDKEVLRKHSEGLICLTACLKGEVASLINRGQFSDARATAKEYKDIFGDDFYLELQDHGIPEEDNARKGAIEIAKELDIKLCGTNDIHYIEEKDWEAHDIMLCMQSGKDLDDPTRMRYETHDIYFKSGDQMCELFKDQPQAIESTLEIYDKINLKLDFGYKYPSFPIPESSGCKTDLEFFEKICREGLEARLKTSKIPKEYQERFDYEFGIIKDMGFASYFLITQDFIGQARLQGIPVGPGRGSAGGSLLAYCMGITNLDPLPYNLLFERFLNPERVTMPDVDIDFCMRRRGEVIDYVKEKYGEPNVAQVITYGRLAPKAVLKDVARILKISYGDADKLSKAIPVTFGKPLSIQKSMEQLPEFKEKIALNDETFNNLFEYAKTLEGLNRQTGKHAAAVVIAPDKLVKFSPLYKRNGEEDVVTQFDMKAVEGIGLLKMDFLGLKTLTVIYDTLELLKAEGIEIDIEEIPIDDEKTYQLFSDGLTVGVFQFESAGMQEYLKRLKPTRIEDLIAMNALYRPGPMDNIPSFIERKFGREEVTYPHFCLEEILKETYGIIVYQEQIMQIAAELCNFSLGKADILRRAMGKKDLGKMEKMKKEFIQGAVEKHNVPEKQINEIWELIFKFANYGFNKSHSACYSWVAYQTAYLKAHYPAHFMAAMMTSEMSTKDGVPKLIEECKKMELEVLQPNVNDSFDTFTVHENKISFGMAAVKNVGSKAINEIVRARKEFGKFKDIFDLTANIDTKICSKKALESLILGGACDSLEGTRAEKFASVEIAITYGQKIAEEKNSDQVSMFDIFAENSESSAIKPKLAFAAPYAKEVELQNEKDLIGFYVSGHPLNNFRAEIIAFSSLTLDEVDKKRWDGKEVQVCGIISKFRSLTTKRKQEKMCSLELEDFVGKIKVLVFPRPYAQCQDAIGDDLIVKVSGRIEFEDEDNYKINANKIESIVSASENASWMNCEIPTDIVSKENLLKVKELLEESPGTCKVRFKLIANDGNSYLVEPSGFGINPSQKLIAEIRQLIGEQRVWLN